MIARTDVREVWNPPALPLLHPRVQQWFWQQGWNGLHPWQAEMVRSLAGGCRDVLLRGSAGSGRTTGMQLAVCSEVLTHGARVWWWTLGGSESDRVERAAPLASALGVSFTTLEELDGSSSLDAAGVVVVSPESFEQWVISAGARSVSLPVIQRIVVESLDEFAGRERGVQIQSQWRRLECAAGAHLPRLACDGTLGDSADQAHFLRAGAGSEVHLVSVGASVGELPLTVSDGDREQPEASGAANGSAPDSVRSIHARVRDAQRRGCPVSIVLPTRRSGPDAPLLARLQLEVVQSLAMVESAARGWCEPALTEPYHASTLVHQILSELAHRGNMPAKDVFGILCQEGPFSEIGRESFVALLLQLQRHELIHRRHDGGLVLDHHGRETVERPEFASCVHRRGAWSVEYDGVPLGVTSRLPPAVGASFPFNGRSWRLEEFDPLRHCLHVTPIDGSWAPGESSGRPLVHGVVRERMFELYVTAEVPRCADASCARRLRDAREVFAAHGLGFRAFLRDEEGVLLLPWCSDRALETLARALQSVGVDAERQNLALRVRGTDEESLSETLRELAERDLVHAVFRDASLDSVCERPFDASLPLELRRRDLAARHFDFTEARQVLERLARGTPPA